MSSLVPLLASAVASLSSIPSSTNPIIGLLDSAVASLTLSSPVTTTNYIPLTTVFTPPKWCSTVRMTFFGDDGGLTSTFWKDSNFPANDSRRESMRSCYPSGFQYQPDLFATDGYIYSPGVCPGGYYAAKSNGLPGQNKEKAATSWCCPEGMTFSAFQGCVSLTTPRSPATLYQYGDAIQMNNPYVVLEPYIPVAWASSDLAEFTPTSAPLSGTRQCLRMLASSSAVLVDGGQAGTPGIATIPGGGSGGMSTDAKVGTGVGVSVTVVAAIVMAVLLFKYRRKAQAAEIELEARDRTENEKTELKSGIVVHETDADSRVEADFEHYRVEADSDNSIRNELDSPVIRAEADGSSLRHELDSGWLGYEK